MISNTNIIFCFDNYVGEAVIEASSEASSEMPVSALVNKNRDLIWRSELQVSPGISEWISIELEDPEEFPVSCIALVDLFMSPAGTVRIRSWADALNGSELGVDETYEAFAAIEGFGVGGFGQGGYGGGAVQDVIDVLKPIALFILPQFREEKYWLVELIDPDTTYTQASHMHIGTHWQPERNISKSFERDVGDRTQFVESVAGTEYGDDRDSRMLMNGVLRNMDQQSADYLWGNFLRLKTRVPFIVSAKPNDTIEQLYTTKLIRFDQLKVTQNGFDNYSAELSMREWL